jgi:hypothetical protein
MFTSRWRRSGLAVMTCTVGLLILAAEPSTAGAVHPHNATTTYGCRSPYLGRQSLPVAVTGNTPTSVSTPFAEVSMSGFQVSVTIPASAVDKAMSKGATAVTTTVKEIDINASDARVKTMNAMNAPVTVGPTTLVTGQAVVVTVPASPSTTGTWAAKKRGTMAFTTGHATIFLNFSSAGSTTLACKATPPAVISTTMIT